MKGLFAVLLLMFFVTSPCLSARIAAGANPSFNVLNFGAKGDGQTDDSQVFLKAWGIVCNGTWKTATLLIPGGKTFLLQPLSFKGPCTASVINFQLQGTIIAPYGVNAWKWKDADQKDTWMRFDNIKGLHVNGGRVGQIDGRGAPWWKSCNSDSACERPTAVHFHNCENLQLEGVNHVNSPKNHISLNRCNGAQVSQLSITAPEDSPNTDGIDISACSNVFIHNCNMATGDDCIAINGGTSFINITSITCGPGHGISIGSLGKGGCYDTVEEIHVQHCTFKATTNGARIKTWEGGSGYARKITFEDIILKAANNPVIIDQHYNPHIEAQSVVKVSDITYRNIKGTSVDVNAIQLNCAYGVGCNNIVMESINITSSIRGKTTYASCQNAHGSSSSTIPKVPCLSPELDMHFHD